MSINTAPALKGGTIINWNNQTYVIIDVESPEQGVTRFKCLNCTSAEEYTLINYSSTTDEYWEAIKGKAEFHYQLGLDCPDHYSRDEEMEHALQSYPTYWREEGCFSKDLPDSLWYDECGPQIAA
tara:strand:+ start:60 stop:434 length:375 start_codon:yes stop_codon:yes gene_type:complete